MSRRRSTIYDAAALRLHPNGVRVNDVVQSPLLSKAAVTTKAPAQARKTPKGNWIATDAGGDARVTKRRKVRKIHSQDPIEGDFIAEGQDEGDMAETRGQDEEIPSKVYKDARANRRVAFENDFTFLTAPTSLPGGNLQPSSDFLKCIHYLASQYYDTRGQLFDSGGQYRKMKREHRLRQAAAESGTQHPNANHDEDRREGEDNRSGSDSFAEELPISKAKCRSKGKARAKCEISREAKRDMYKAFDGSALLCIGMLLQSHITSSLANNVTDTLEDDRSSDSHEDTDTEFAKMQSGVR